MKNSEKQWKKQPWILALHLGFPNHELSFELHFWSGPIEFLSKMVPCICNFNLASIGLRSSSKGLGSNL